MRRPLAFISGPLFNEGERWFQEQIETWAKQADFDTFLPHRDAEELARTGDVQGIFKLDKDAIDKSDLIICNLDGVCTDDGSAWEIGYAFAKGKHLLGILTDFRLRSKFSDVNLMLQFSLNKLFKNSEDLKAYL